MQKAKCMNLTQWAAPPLRTVTKISKTTSTERETFRTNNGHIGSSKRFQGPQKRKGERRFYAFEHFDKEIEDTTKRKKPTCGPVRFPEMSCEEQQSTAASETSYKDFNLDDILGDDENSSKTEAAETSNITPTNPSGSTTPLTNSTFPNATKTIRTTTLRRIARTYRSYYRNVPRGYRRPPYKMYRIRQYSAGEVTPTSSTRPYGWESTPSTVAKLPEACNKMAKCEDQTW